jgi:hypothetical protein
MILAEKGKAKNKSVVTLITDMNIVVRAIPFKERRSLRVVRAFPVIKKPNGLTGLNVVLTGAVAGALPTVKTTTSIKEGTVMTGAVLVVLAMTEPIWKKRK